MRVNHGVFGRRIFVKHIASIKTMFFFSAFLILGLAIFPVYAADQVVTNNGDSGAGTLRQTIIDAGDNDTITFNLASGSETITVSSQLLIEESLTINGSNDAGSGVEVTVQVTTPGTSAFRVFHINQSGKTVNISNMTIKGGNIYNADQYGGAIYNQQGTLTLNKVTVSSSKALEGGGIYNASTLYLYNSTITGNTAYDALGGIAGGGGLYSNGTLLHIENSTISNNTTTEENLSENDGYGGGIYISSGTACIVNATISGNEVYAEEGTAPSGYGGGIYNGGGSLKMLNTIVINNEVFSDTTYGDDIYGTVSGYYCWTGDAISGSANNTTSFSSDLNALSYNGGFTETFAVTSSGNAGNKAGSGTYAYYNPTDGYYFYNGSNYTKISDGNAFDDGSESDKILTDQRGYYRNTTGTRTVTRGAYQYDGVVAKIGTGTDWTGGTDTYTTIKGAYDGAADASTIVLAGTAIYEAGIALNAGKSITIQGADDYSTIVQADDTPNTASDRVFNVTGGTVTLEDMTIRNGNVSGDGGGIYIGASAELTMNDCVVSGNTATSSSYGYGGGIYAYGSTTLTNCTISGNRAVGPGAEGGGILATAGSGSAITLTNCTISGNEAFDNVFWGAYGGGISIVGDAGAALLNCTISGNTVTSVDAYGAGVFLSLGTANVKNTIIAQNSDNANANDYVYGGGTLNDQGYNVVEYQNLSALAPNDEKAFNVTTDILYNTIVGTDTTLHGHWNQNGSDFDGSLNLSSTLALNDSFNGTYTLARGGGELRRGK